MPSWKSWREKHISSMKAPPWFRPYCLKACRSPIGLDPIVTHQLPQIVCLNAADAEAPFNPLGWLSAPPTRSCIGQQNTQETQYEGAVVLSKPKQWSIASSNIGMLQHQG